MRAGAGEFVDGAREEPNANGHATQLPQYTGACAARRIVSSKCLH
jgi:hypothetical protein